MTPLSRSAIAERLAQDLEEGWYANLGIGLPTLVANHIPPGREVLFHSENGIVGMGPAPSAGLADPWLINASKKHITLLPGASLVHQADSFAMIRGGHLDLCVLGAFQVAPNGDIANWSTGTADMAPAVGGAMDLAAGAKRVWAILEHTTKDGRPRLVPSCTYPLTAPGVVSRVYTSLGVFEAAGDAFRVVELAPGVALDALQACTGARLC